jgi:sulfur carrier protein
MPPVPDAGKPCESPMQIQLNGEPRRFECAPTVSELLEAVGLGGRRVAVEVNRAIVPRSRHGDLRLDDGDVVEIVQALGGG